MCGITGVYAFDGFDHSKITAVVDRQLHRIEHRGRDESNTYIDRKVGLGIARLSIIDLECGSQPISSADGRYVIVYNGELYNYREIRDELVSNGHRFRTRSDTEVVLNAYIAYGDGCLEKFNGMFAFAIWDNTLETLFLARDRFGVKPLYYHLGNDCFSFGSELQTILVVDSTSRQISLQGLSVYLSHNYLPPPFTLFKDIRQLAHGHFLIVKNNKTFSVKRWHRPKQVNCNGLSQGELDDRFDFYFKQAVERQMVSDVSVGAFLSGGLDSSAIVSAITSEARRGINTFSIGFDDKEYDETPYALEVSRQFGTRHFPITIDAEMYFRHFIESIPFQANPVADQACVQVMILSKLARQHVKVCLSGDGGDELLGGYVTVLADRYQPIMNLLPNIVLKACEVLLNNLKASTGKITLDYKLNAFLKGAGLTRQQAHATWRMINDYREITKMVSRSVDIRPEWLYQPYLDAYGQSTKDDFFAQTEEADMNVWLVGNNFLKVDMMSMAANLEVRVPFLDNDLVDFLLGVPFSKKVQGTKLKIILKRFLKQEKLSPYITGRKKAGFHAPIAKWFKGPLRGKMKEIINDCGSIYREGILNKNAVITLYDDHINGYSNNAFKLFGLALLLLWHERYC